MEDAAARASYRTMEKTRWSVVVVDGISQESSEDGSRRRKRDQMMRGKMEERWLACVTAPAAWWSDGRNRGSHGPE